MRDDVWRSVASPRKIFEWALRRRQRIAAGSPGTIWVYGYARGRLLKVNVNADDQEYVRTVAWADE
jgi:hypothetical protein